MATDEEVAVRLLRRKQPCVAQARAGRVHLRIVDALRRLPERPAAVALEPGLVLPRLTIDERTTVQLRRHRPLRLASRMDRPEQLGGSDVLTGAQVTHDPRDDRA